MGIKGLAGIAAALVLVAWVCGTAAAQQTGIDEIRTVAANETVTVGGTTNLAPGNRLLVTVTPVGFGPTNKSAPQGTGGTSGTAVVEEGDAANTWSFEIDTTGFEPGEYTVTVDWIEGDATASTTFTVVEAAGVTPTPTGTPAATTPSTTAATTAATTSPTPTAAGSVLPAAATLAAGLAGYLVRRR
ncbi:MAG: hypothetical protein KO254_00645 [Methanoculleus marisnigri]|uniref:Uncharacterized protein n=2 Tax=Methanoculleus TaxID=45989 RepID=A3CYC8_METMJ|nr:hypothetical protein Memar_2457 [Methanoculleus marisnigri JR1]MCC7554618.1 hypothetical protein [Methanoculleus marisnigri]